MRSAKLSLFLHGISWSFVSVLSIQASKFFISLYLAKLLGPEIIGTYIIYLITVEVSSFVNDFGFGAQYFRRRDKTDLATFAGTALILQRAVTALYVLLCATIFMILGFESALVFFAMVSSKASAMWFAIHSAQLYRDYGYKIEAIINLCLISVVILLIVSFDAEIRAIDPLLLCALAFIVMNLSSIFVAMIVRNGFYRSSLNRDFVAKMMSSGRAFFFDNIVNRYRNHLENLVLVAFLGRAELALVARSKTVVSTPMGIIMGTVRNPLLSVLRSTQISRKTLDLAIIVFAMVMLVISSIYVFFFLPLLENYLGDDWNLTISLATDLAPYLCILTFLGLQRIFAISEMQESLVAKSAGLELALLLPLLALVLLFGHIHLIPIVMIISVSLTAFYLMFFLKAPVSFLRRLIYAVAVGVIAASLSISSPGLLGGLFAVFGGFACHLLYRERYQYG